MRVIFTKTDALGDQLFASGYLRQILTQIGPDLLVWFVRRGHEGVSALFKGSRVFMANTSADPRDEAKNILLMSHAPALAWGRVVFAPVSLDPYSAWPEDRDVCRELSWWFDFVEAIGVDIAIAGTFDLNWVDQALVLASKAEKRVAVQAHRHSQVLPEEAVRILEARHIPIGFTHTVEHDPERHELDSFAELLRATDGQSHSLGFDLDPIESPSESGLIATTGPTIVVAPGAGDLKRTYPVDKMVEAIKLIRQAVDNQNLVVLSGPKDTEVVGCLLTMLEAENIPARLLSLKGDEIPKLVGILRGASLLICAETFIAHLATYLGTPTVAIWGGGHWGRFLPRSGRVTLLHIPILCRPCNWFCCFSQRHCLTDISPTEIMNAALRRLNEARKVGPFAEAIECAGLLSNDEVLDALRAKSEESFNLQAGIRSLKKWLDMEVEAKNKALKWSEEAEAMKVHWEGLFREAEKQRDMERELRLQEAAAKEKALAWAHDAEAMKSHWEGLFRMAEQDRDKERDLRVQEAEAKEAALKWAQAAESMKVHWETLFRAAESQLEAEIRRQPQIEGGTK
jgi:ADP-heptose:LPS heptosyltransferase